MAELLGIQRRPLQPFGTDWVDDLAALNFAPGRIFDVGANVGQTVSVLKRRFPRAEIHAFEPVPTAFEQLSEMACSMANVLPVQAAVSDRRGVAPMAVAGSSERNTLVSKPDVPGASIIEVPLMTVDQYAAERNIDFIDLLKIDTEGHEVAVLDGAASILQSGQVDFVLAECDFNARPRTPHGDFLQIHHKMLRFNYRVVAFYCHGVDGQGWDWGDVLYMRPADVPAMRGSRRRFPPIARQFGPAQAGA
jgi:FkbM family methyltransferase